MNFYIYESNIVDNFCLKCFAPVNNNLASLYTHCALPEINYQFNLVQATGYSYRLFYFIS